MLPQIVFDNSNHNGQVNVDLSSDLSELTCNGPSPLTSTGETVKKVLFSIDILALIFSAISFMLCCRSIIRLYKFWQVELFLGNKGKGWKTNVKTQGKILYNLNNFSLSESQTFLFHGNGLWYNKQTKIFLQRFLHADLLRWPVGH